jgi:hypothetical protein
MDDRPRREEKNDGRSTLTMRPNDAEPRIGSLSKPERANERPALTPLESKDPWPIG